MSLSLEPIDSNSKHVASVYENKDFSQSFLTNSHNSSKLNSSKVTL